MGNYRTHIRKGEKYMPIQKEYFQSLSNLSRELGKTDDQEKMLHLIVSVAVETLKAKAAVIFLNEEDSEDSIRNVAVAQVGLSEKYIHAGTAHAVKISPQLLKDGYMYFRDATTDKRLMNHKAKKRKVLDRFYLCRSWIRAKCWAF
jgi:GAF domain-containing protein